MDLRNSEKSDATRQVEGQKCDNQATQATDKKLREMVRNTCSALSCRAFDPGADILTMAEQMIQAGKLILEELKH